MASIDRSQPFPSPESTDESLNLFLPMMSEYVWYALHLVSLDSSNETD